MSEPIYLDCAQGSLDWHKARLGRVTASEFSRVLTPSMNLSKQREGYLHELLYEWATGNFKQLPSLYWVERGSELESEARDYYQLRTGLSPRAVGLVYKNEDRLVVCSPDWIVDDSVGVEVKVPAGPTHVGYMLGGTIPKAYVPQVQFSLYVTGFASWQFMSYSDEFNEHLLVDAPKIDEWQEAIAEALDVFLPELMRGRERLLDLGVKPATPMAGDTGDASVREGAFVGDCPDPGQAGASPPLGGE